MNEAQKNVLQRHHRQLADDLYLTEDLLGALFQNKVFERHMIEMIRAEKTPSEQVHKMLAILPRRGPDAFDTFLNVIKEDYPWLTATMEQSYKSQINISRSNSLVNSKDVCTCGLPRDSVDGPLIPKGSDSNIVDVDIKGRVGTFIHKQFGQSKRISEKDKKSMEKWFSEQLQVERKRLKTSMSVQSESESGNDSVDGQTPEQYELEQMQVKLDRLYGKLRQKNISTEVNNNDNSDSEELCVTPGLASIHMVDVEIDALLAKLDQLETTVYQSYLILGDKERKHTLTNLVQDLQYEKSQQEKELHKEKNKIEKMLTELYDYSKTINKLETQRNQLRVQVDNRGSEIGRMLAEKDELVAKIKQLEAQNQQHIEKEKTLENLRKIVKDLKSSKENIVDENMNYRYRSSDTQMSSTASRPFRRSTRVAVGTGRRASIVETNFNTNIRRTGTKATINPKRNKPGISYKP